MTTTKQQAEIDVTIAVLERGNAEAARCVGEDARGIAASVAVSGCSDALDEAQRERLRALSLALGEAVDG